MFNRNKIEEISKVSKAERWPFPKTLFSLKDAGVEYYDVDLATEEIVYHGNGESMKQARVTALQDLPQKGQFDQNALIKAIVKHQTEKTSYSDFVKEIVKAGIVYYRVNTLERTCTYFGSEKGESHSETIL